VKAGADVIALDTAHGHSASALRTLKEVKPRYGVEVIAGNVATYEGARDLNCRKHKSSYHHPPAFSAAAGAARVLFIISKTARIFVFSRPVLPPGGRPAVGVWASVFRRGRVYRVVLVRQRVKLAVFVRRGAFCRHNSS